MIVVIIAGGAGTRLWPLSTRDYPKHLLNLVGNNSLLQDTYARVKNLSEHVLVIPEASHADHVYKQLSEVPKSNIIVEPARRGTASCVLLALSEIKKRGWNNQPILFLWADHLIRDTKGFSSAVKQAEKLAAKHQKLVFMGVEPTYAATGFGYMEKGELVNGYTNVYELKQFVEKPNKASAQKYFASGEYLWNMGYLVGTLEVFEREMQEKSKRMWKDYQKLNSAKNTEKVYMDLVSEPIDTALSEHVVDALLVPGTFDWVDVGSFHDLHAVIEQDNQSNHVKGKLIYLDTTTNSYIRNDDGLPVAVIGLDNVVVVVNDNGILVANKNYAQKVGDLAKEIQKPQ